MKWTYRECVVTITAAFGSPALFRPTITITTALGPPASFRPIVEIYSRSSDPPTALTTGKTFLTSEQALEFGQDMAREWIDGHFKGGADHSA